MEDNKYPENYFEHYIVCFFSTDQTPDEAGFQKLARLYLDLEGLTTFSELINEIQLIKENNDWSYFEKGTKDFEINLGTVEFKKMAEVAIKVFKDLS
ncbi:hypothetical protein BK133_27825 [Paenibacillus sp. FSL H8-0548]|uniref:hypothetical protein n=1 Tax=Paenibacillus sp. FSL H8-0548 TaxID=1920422 RepID=UPI00096F9551|nr:hypothetical protein [Paenibacillus sp. FSL H8-0548]OMF21778.1 hypothetical protein BK133_27825 [Paenibacillus sp. FSL H8-0548]